MTLAIIAGRGDLPALVAGAVDTPPLICGYEGVEVSGVTLDLTFRLETLGTLLLELGKRGVTEICFAGGLDRPALDPSKLDAETAPLVPLFMEALKAGDDGALRVVVELFEKTGFSVIGAHEVAPDLLAKGGVYGTHWPDKKIRDDAITGATKIRDMSSKDQGQACIVLNGKILAMEDASGTDAMIGTVRHAKGGILFKGPKQDQSRKIDLPTVGPATLKAAALAGLRAVIIDADDVLVLHADECTAIANTHGLIFWARTGE